MKKKKKIIIVLAIIIIILTSTYFGYKKLLKEKSTMKEDISTQEYVVTLMDISQTYSTSGNVFSKNDKVYHAPFYSNSFVFTADIGDYVGKGDQIGFFDDTEIKIDLLTQEKAVLVTESELQQLISEGDKSYYSDFENTRIEYEDAKKTYENNLNLYKNGVISLNELEESKSEIDNTNLLYVLATGKYDGFNLKNEIEIIKRNLDVEKLRLKQLEYDYEKVSLVAETSGTIAETFIDSGNLVEENQELLRVIDIENLEIITDISEYEIKDIKEGQDVEVTILGDESVNIKGIVQKVYPSATISGTDVTVTVVVSIEDKNRVLKPGFSTNIEIMIANKAGAKVVPYDALLSSPRGHMVIKIVDGEEVKTPVKTGVESDLMIEIISDEINEGDIIKVDSTIDFSGEKFRDNSKIPMRRLK